MNWRVGRVVLHAALAMTGRGPEDTPVPIANGASPAAPATTAPTLAPTATAVPPTAVLPPAQ